MDDVKKIAFCPHCSNKSTQDLLICQHTTDIGWTIPDGKEYMFTVMYYVVKCETCEHILVYQALDDIPEDNNFSLTSLVFPDIGILDNSVPKTIVNIYQEASRIKNIASNAFAVQIRRALEALCEDRGAKRDSLQNMLNELANKGEIPKTLTEVSDLIRLLGNIGAHVADESVMPWQVYTMDEFFRAIIEYVYVAPSKIKYFRSGLKSK